MESTLVARRRVALLATLFVLIAFSEWLFWLGSHLEQTPWWVSALFPAFAIGATVKCFHTRSLLTENERRSWTFFGLGYLGFALAEVIYAACEIFLGGVRPGPSLNYISYAAFPICFIIGIWHYRARILSTDDTFVRIGSLGIIFSAALIIYAFMYAEFLRAATSIPRASITVAYGVVDLSAVLFGLFVLLLQSQGYQRRVLLLILTGLCFNAVTDFTFVSAIMDTRDLSASLVSGLYLLVPSFIIWAAFEQDQVAKMEGECTVNQSPSEIEPRSTRWQILLPPFTVAGVLVFALAFRDQFTEDLISFAVAGSVVFIGSLAIHNWWGHKLEVRLRTEALQSKGEMQTAYRELRKEMKIRTQVQEELRQAQKMDALGQLTGGIAHDFNNLLAVVIGNLELLESDVPMAPQQASFLREAAAAAERGARLTQRLLALARKQPLRAEPIEVDSLLENTKDMLARTLGERIQLTIRGYENAGICLADRVELENAILNLVLNARDAMPHGGEIEITATDITLDEGYVSEHPDARVGAFVAFSVRDSGVGIPAEDLPRVFNPFFTTKEVGSGTGLGLSMVYGFAKQSGGHVAIESRVGSGTRVTFYIPQSETRVGSTEAESRTDVPRGSGESVLLVEDDPAVRKLVSNILKDLGYQVTEARDGEVALALFEGVGTFDLLLSDVVLPGSYSGRDLATVVARQRPQTEILLMSGYESDVFNQRGISARTSELLHKPFGKAELAHKIRSLLDSRES
jgi:signal transduction histidine kinase/ActR/RegA family two-component response regulator